MNRPKLPPVLTREDFPSSARNHLPGVVLSAEVAGPGLIRVTLDCGQPVVAVITQESWRELGLTVGTSAFATFKASAVRSCS